MEKAEEEVAAAAQEPRQKIPTKTVDPKLGVGSQADFHDFRVRMQDAYGDPTPSADKAIEQIEGANLWGAFEKWLRTQGTMNSWDDFVDSWNEWQKTKPEHRISKKTTVGAGAHFAETPETLHLQPKAKAQARAKAKGSLEGNSTYQGRGSRPRARKIELTKPVIPYHDIMNDGYYVK
jgi:hypothetical protein